MGDTTAVPIGDSTASARRVGQGLNTGATGGPLAGVRVVDATDDSGRFATKLLAELGADVVRVVATGSRGTRLADPAADALGGVLDWWYDGGKRRHLVDLETPSGRQTFLELIGHADMLVETFTPGELSRLGVGHDRLIEASPALVHVALTPFGSTGPRSRWVTSDLVSSALAGVLSVTGTPERPLNLWGRQAYNFAGYAAVIAGLAALHDVRRGGRGRHIDLSIHETVTTGVEHLFVYLFFDDEMPDHPKVAVRQGALHWLRIYDLAATADGHVMITPSPAPPNLVEWMIEEGHAAAAMFAGLDRAELRGRGVELMAVIRDFVADRPTTETWIEAQRRHCALGGVLDIAQVAQNPQFAHRRLFADAPIPGSRPGTEPGSGSGAVRMPARTVRFTGCASTEPRPPAAADTPFEELLSSWRRERAAPTEGQQGGDPSKPLAGLRVTDFTWVLAGPFSTRMLGDLGADVVRVQSAARSTIVNVAEHPYFNVWNRSKRSATIDMKHPDGLDAVRRLVEKSDVVIENFSAGVFASWGLDWETMRSWNPRLIYMTMSGCGHDGPWSHVISYAPTVHALCGITHLTNFDDERDLGAGFSVNDHLAGFAAASAVLAALDHRHRTGEGQMIDMAQLEVGTHSIGPALIERFANGRSLEPAGNKDGLHDHVPNEVYATSDGHVAVTVITSRQWAGLVGVVGGAISAPELADEGARRRNRQLIDVSIAGWAARRTADQAMRELQAVGVPAGAVQDALQLFEDDEQHVARELWVDIDHASFGSRPVDQFPALFDGVRPAIERSAPSYLGEHNFEVWTELAGYDFEAVAEKMGDGLFD